MSRSTGLLKGTSIDRIDNKQDEKLRDDLYW